MPLPTFSMPDVKPMIFLKSFLGNSNVQVRLRTIALEELDRQVNRRKLDRHCRIRRIEVVRKEGVEHFIQE